MSTTNELRKALIELFRSGEDAEHDAGEMEELLDGINFQALAQALRNDQERVYAYFTETQSVPCFDYYGATLFPQAVLLVQQLEEDRGDDFDFYCWKRYLELWLLPDMRLSVVSCLQTGAFGNSRIAEYRAIKEGNWKEEGMEINFLDFAAVLEEKANQHLAQELPTFEL